ncbi:MAG: polyhydroxyalkanoic acid system family protein [Deltaproteobacteria bacterium]|nr:polyhydroxyalkanoic acid system family protein [Deltaproteobacteria bacterium]
MRHAIAHDLPPDLAQRTARAACAHYCERFGRYDPRIIWRDDHHADLQFAAKGLTIKGKVAVTAGSLVVDVDIPFLLRPFQGRAVEIVERELQKWIAKAKAGEIV